MSAALTPEQLVQYRRRWVVWSDRASQYLAQLREQLDRSGNTPAGPADIAADSTLRNWRNLDPRPVDDPPYSGILLSLQVQSVAPEMAKASRFWEQIYAFSLQWEGSRFTNHPQDKGGPTRYGVIQRVYDQYRRASGLATRSVQHISIAERDAIYWQNYWEPVWGSSLPPRVAACAFDFGVNSGPSRSVKYLQWALNLPQTGRMSERVIAACLDANEAMLVADLLAKREGFLRGIVRGNPSQVVFLKGWLNRVKALRTFLKTLPGEA